MRYALTDDAARPERLLAPPRYRHTLVDVIGGDAGGAAAVLRDFFEGITRERLAPLRLRTAAGAGYGHELAASLYADDLDADDDPFDGVRITAQFRDDDVVLSRAAYERLIAALPDPP